MTTQDQICGRPTKKGTPCKRGQHYWLEGLSIHRADGCWRHMSSSFQEAAEQRKQQDEAAWQAYLGADPICWSWPLPMNLEDWSYPQGDSINEQLSPAALERIMRDPEVRASGILRDWQDGRCAICGRRDSLVEDHDHDSGLTRGYLCRGCNIQEGIYRHGVHLFSRYRERHPTRLLGLSIRYWDPITGEYAPQLSEMTEAERQAERWTDAASEDIGL